MDQCIEWYSCYSGGGPQPGRLAEWLISCHGYEVLERYELKLGWLV
jgi:hypothetical protein